MLKLKQNRLRSVSAFLHFMYVLNEAWSVYSVRRFQGHGCGFALTRWHLHVLGQALLLLLAMSKRTHVCYCPFFTAQTSNCHFVLFIETELVCSSVFSCFSLQLLSNTTEPRLFFEVCLVEAELKIFVYFAILWQLAATEMRHVKQLPQKEISNLQVQTKVEETNLLCSCSVLYSLLIFSHLRIFNFPNWENVTLQLRRKGKIKSRILSFSTEQC